MRVFIAYRPRWPSLRAQALQVFYSSHALASLGVDVTVCFHPADGDLWGWFGLKPVEGLHLRPLAKGGTAASLGIRGEMVRWARGGRGVILAREKKLADLAQRYLWRHPVVLEAHEVDSLQGRPQQLQLERRVLRRSAALICNCEGVRDALGWLHDVPSVVRVIHNAAQPRILRERGSRVVYAGSLLPSKDVETVARAAETLGGVTLLGEHSSSRVQGLQTLAAGELVAGGPVRPADLLETLARFEVALLPLGTGWFGRELTSPLKGFSYRAAGLPIVGADTPALRRALGDRFIPYAPGDVQSLVEGVEEARARWSDLREGSVRTWSGRAAEVASVLGEVM